MNKKIIYLFLFLLGGIAGIFLMYKIGEMSEGTANYPWRFYAKVHKTNVNFSEYAPFVDDDGAWYQTRLIAHGCGAIDGNTYTNSREALEHAIENGYTVIEVDFSSTSDGQVVLKHDWADGIPTYEEYMSTYIEKQYSPVDLKMLFAYMEQNRNLYIVTDIKGDAGYRKAIFEQVVSYAVENHLERCLDRMIVQIYWEKDYAMLCDIYPFSNWIYTLYVSGNRDFDGVAKFCLENNIRVVTMGSGWKALENVRVFDEMNIKVFTFSVNDIEVMKREKEMGIDGWYTDFVTYEDLSGVDTAKE